MIVVIGTQILSNLNGSGIHVWSQFKKYSMYSIYLKILINHEIL